MVDLNDSMNTSNLDVSMQSTNGNRSFWSKLASLARRKKEKFDSIYDCEKPKVKKFALKADSSTLGFACFLKKDQLGLDLSYE